MPSLYRLWPTTASESSNFNLTFKFGERAFRVAAPRLGNELPSDIRKASTLATFKKHLKTFLFFKHYGTILEQ